MNSLKYMGVHSATTTIAVLDFQGKQVMDVSVETQAATLVDFLRGLRDSLYLTLEGGNFAAWLAEVLSPHVRQLIVCNPRRNARLESGHKSDRIDACKLAALLRAGLITPVYHDPSTHPPLKELARSYVTPGARCHPGAELPEGVVSKPRFCGGGTRVYSPRFRSQWFEQLPEHGVRHRTELLYAQLDLLRKLRQHARVD